MTRYYPLKEANFFSHLAQVHEFLVDVARSVFGSTEDYVLDNCASTRVPVQLLQETRSRVGYRKFGEWNCHFAPQGLQSRPG